MAMMISKFNKIIHNKTVWLVFAIVISVAFVAVYTGDQTDMKSYRAQQQSAVAGRLFGEEVSQIEFGQAYQNVYVMYSMMTGREVNLNEEVDEIIRRAAWQRLATLKKARQMGLTVTNEQIVDMIQDQPVFRNQQTGQFDKNAYNAFVSGFLPRLRMGPKDFENMVAENVLIEKASGMAAQGALVTDEEVRKAFHLYNDKLTVQYAALPRSLAQVPAITEEDAKAYYDRNAAQFALPERAIVHYVQFPVANYTNAVSVTDEMVAQVYESNKQRYLKPAAEGAAPGAAPEYQPLEEVKGAIAEMVSGELARRQATVAADAFVGTLVNGTAFEQAAQQAALAIVSNTPAFTATASVRGVDPTAPFARAAFALSPGAESDFSDPVVGRDTVYVIKLVKFQPVYQQPFEAVKADAMESARLAAEEKAYVEKAEAVHAEIEAALKAGTSFADAASKYNLELQTTAPFNATSQLEDEMGRQIMGATMMFDAGTLVELISTPNEFLVAYVAERQAADEAATLPALREDLVNSIRNEKARAMVAAWQESLLKEAGFEDLTKSADSGDES